MIVLDTCGPLPTALSTFRAESNMPCNLVVSATVYASSANVAVGISVVVDGQAVGEIRFFCNKDNVHVTLPVKTFPLQLDFSSHTIQLVGLTAATATDSNDYFQATVEY
jgi:hypothetical protein